MEDFEDLYHLNDIKEFKEFFEHEATQPKIYRTRKNPFIMYTDKEFRRKYRFSKEEAKYIIDLIKMDLKEGKSERGKPIPIEIKVLAALSGFARNRVQDDTGDLHGFSQPTMSRINKEVAEALAKKMSLFINFPTSVTEQTQVMDDFKKIAGMQKIIGAIDCTHIKIKKTGGDLAQTYIDRKGNYSLNVQVICDGRGKITNIVARWRGSAHDSRIFNESSIKDRFENGEFIGNLVGDSGYASTQYMLTPVLNPKTQAEEAYNMAQKSTRNLIERVFGQWKQRFRGLLRGLYTKLDTVKTTIVALAVLHNVAIDLRSSNEWSDSEDDDSDSEEEINETEAVSSSHTNENTLRGDYARQQYIQRFYS